MNDRLLNISSPALGEEVRFVHASGAPAIIAAALGILLTLYMMAILLRWLGSWLEISARSRTIRFASLVTDPLINLMRRFLPPMGPFDWGPMAAIVTVWLLRLLLVGY